MSELSTTVSVHQKINLGNYESQDLFVSMTIGPDTTPEEMRQLLDQNEIAYDLAAGELARRVNLIRNPPKDNVIQLPTHESTVMNLVKKLQFSKEQCREFKAICDNRGLDHIRVFLHAHEDGCTSYDEFVCYAATDTLPENARPRIRSNEL